jgi:hypothetical protein
MGPVDEDFFEDVVAVRKSASEFVEIRPPLVPTERFRAADLDDHPR